MSRLSNPHRGETALEIGGKRHLLVYDWHAIAALRSELGSGFDQRIGEAAAELDLDTLAVALEAGLAKHHPGQWTREAIMDASPPIVPVARAIQQALVRAFHGNEPPPEGQPENPPNARRTTLWSRLSGLRSKRA